MLEGVRWRQEQEWERTAWLAANFINISGKTAKKKITVDKLLGRRPPKPRDVMDDVKELLRRQQAIDAKKAN